MDDALRLAHVLAGGIALATFWVPLVAAKGGRAHGRAGWIYSVAMLVASVTAWVVCGLRLSDSQPANDGRAIFLAYVGVLAANSAISGIRAIRTKSRTRAVRNPFDLAVSAALLLGGAAIATWGLGDPLPMGFGILGAVLAMNQLRFWLRPPVAPREWLIAHLGNMLAACIGTLTAFAVTNVASLGLQELAIVAWIAPGVLGGIAIGVWTAYYRRQFRVARDG